MTTIIEKNTFAPQPIDWGAVIAGLLFTFALSWLLFTLGSAIGLSVIEFFDPASDEIDPEAMTLSLSLLIWIFITTLIAFFFGGLLSGRLAGIADRSVGMLHGIAVWSSGVILSLFLGAIGVSGLTSTALNALKATTTAGGLASVVAYQNNGDVQIPASLQPLVATLKREISVEMAQRVNNKSGTKTLSGKTLNTAAQQLNTATLVNVARALIKNNTEYAKDLIAGSTELTESQVNQLVNTVKAEVDKAAEKLQKKADSMEDYLTGVLWIVFVSSAAALLASIFGGWVGVTSVARIYSIKLY